MTDVKKTGKTIADFRALHDKNFIVPQKIKTALEKLGNDGWEYELEFVKTANVSLTDLALFRDQFAEFWLTVGASGREKRVWAGSKSLANKLREMV